MDGHPSSLRELREALKNARPAVPVGKMSAEDIKKELDYHSTAKKTLAAKEARLAALEKAREAKQAKKAEPKKADPKKEAKELFPAVAKAAKETPKKDKKAELAELKKKLAELESD